MKKGLTIFFIALGLLAHAQAPVYAPQTIGAPHIDIETKGGLRIDSLHRDYESARHLVLYDPATKITSRGERIDSLGIQFYTPDFDVSNSADGFAHIRQQVYFGQYWKDKINALENASDNTITSYVHTTDYWPFHDSVNERLDGLEALGGGTNIYNSDGILTGNRTLNGGGHDLGITNTSYFSINATDASLPDSRGNFDFGPDGIYLNTHNFGNTDNYGFEINTAPGSEQYLSVSLFAQNSASGLNDMMYTMDINSAAIGHRINNGSDFHPSNVLGLHVANDGTVVFDNVPAYTSNAAAVADGKETGTLFRLTSGGIDIVH